MNPPHWAEGTLRAMLKPRDRDTISGDLLEEYRELVHSCGGLCANLWYLRQVVSLLTLRGAFHLGAESAQRSGMVSALFWAIAAGLVEYVFFVFVPASFGLPLGASLFVLFGSTLGIGAATAIHTLADVTFLWQASVPWALIFVAAMAATLIAGVLAPGALVVSVFAIFVTAGFRGASGTGQVRMGVLTAMATSLTGSLLTFLLCSAIGVKEPHPPIAVFLWIAIGFSTLLGALGATLQKWGTARSISNKEGTLCLLNSPTSRLPCR